MSIDTLNRSALEMLASMAEAPAPTFDVVASLRDSAAKLRAANKPSAVLVERMANDAESWPAIYASWARQQEEYAARFADIRETV